MSDWKENEDDERTISLDDLEDIEHEKEHRDDPLYNEDDWGSSYDDLDSEAWDRQYRKDDNDEVEPDPWDLE